MATGFRFEVYAIKNTTDYKLIKNVERVQQISDNFKKDSLWGWCEVVVKIYFDKFTEKSSLANASYASEEDFKSSPDYDILKESAIEELRIYLNFALKVLATKTEEYYQDVGKENPYLNPS